MTLELLGTPYSLEATGEVIFASVEGLLDRVDLLRRQGALTEATLRDYFGDKRFEQIAESNALEGSTLDVGETRLAVLQGVTITGHDPAYTRDAITLARALDRMHELAGIDTPTDIDQIQQIHALIFGDRPGGGVFRNEPVRIAGSNHRPPKSWKEVMGAMEQLEDWSRSNTFLSSPLRAIVLHTWLTHIHPYLDGNGRTARAILNLELIRGGFPSIIIRRKDRVRYIEALGHSDEAGDLAPIAELVTARAEDALRDLERAASRQQGYDVTALRLVDRQRKRLAIWNDAMKLLFSLLEDAATQAFGTAGTVSMRWYDDQLLLEDFIALSQGDSAGNAWLFRMEVEVPALGSARYLAWTGYRSDQMQKLANVGPGPSIFWSVPDLDGVHKWVRKDEVSPGGAELSLELPNVDRWIVRRGTESVIRLSPSDLVASIVRDVDAALL